MNTPEKIAQAYLRLNEENVVVGFRVPKSKEKYLLL
ncbi:hypothetical protein LCGC14_0809920 [marine sediment metagenome]|uniref:Uncharacterized protein n=1 Tax=marine sediment metagenome TaxID=412755 RepID=A0A0F9PM50_9ZZZZ